MPEIPVQLEIEEWIVKQWLPDHFGTPFAPATLKLRSGGFFPFDAVSEDGRIVSTISTGGLRAISGEIPACKIFKLRSDIYFLGLVEAQRRVIVLTEPEMWAWCEREAAASRVPSRFECLCAQVPIELRMKLAEARIRESLRHNPSPPAASVPSPKAKRRITTWSWRQVMAETERDHSRIPASSR